MMTNYKNEKKNAAAVEVSLECEKKVYHGKIYFLHFQACLQNT